MPPANGLAASSLRSSSLKVKPAGFGIAARIAVRCSFCSSRMAACSAETALPYSLPSKAFLASSRASGNVGSFTAAARFCAAAGTASRARRRTTGSWRMRGLRVLEGPDPTAAVAQWKRLVANPRRTCCQGRTHPPARGRHRASAPPQSVPAMPLPALDTTAPNVFTPGSSTIAWLKNTTLALAKSVAMPRLHRAGGACAGCNCTQVAIGTRPPLHRAWFAASATFGSTADRMIERRFDDWACRRPYHPAMQHGAPNRNELRNIARRAMFERGMQPDFSAAVIAETNAVTEHLPAAGPPLRDLRNLLWASIDNDDSRDLDQLTVAQPAAGGTRILVAVADVDGTVRQRSATDQHARINTTSVYTAAQVFPMLPERLSTDLTSLGEGRERAAIVIDMAVADDGAVTAGEVYRAVVINRAKL